MNIDDKELDNKDEEVKRRRRLRMYDFQRESWDIEDDGNYPTQMEEIDFFVNFVYDNDHMTIGLLLAALKHTAPHARGRFNGEIVRAGDHQPPIGGMNIMYALENLCDRVNNKELTPWQAHVEFEMLHPFTDGNGRVGRLLWRWMMYNQQQPVTRSFLHEFYYQTLEAQQDV